MSLSKSMNVIGKMISDAAQFFRGLSHKIEKG